MAGPTACRLCGRSFVQRGSGGRHTYCKRCREKADKKVAGELRADCKECGGNLPAKARLAAYCSDQCRSEAARRRNREYQRRYMADPEKRARFMARARVATAARRAAVRGARPPARAARRQRGAAAAEAAPCRLCGRGFEKYGGLYHVYCKKCADMTEREASRALRVDCKECGKRFTTTNRSVRYCSKACSDAGCARASRESHRRRMADPDAKALASARQRAWGADARARK